MVWECMTGVRHVLREIVRNIEGVDYTYRIVRRCIFFNSCSEVRFPLLEEGSNAFFLVPVTYQFSIQCVCPSIKPDGIKTQ
jgi:hypothetical protein